jgi:hypothetical protein
VPIVVVEHLDVPVVAETEQDFVVEPQDADENVAALAVAPGIVAGLGLDSYNSLEDLSTSSSGKPHGIG